MYVDESYWGHQGDEEEEEAVMTIMCLLAKMFLVVASRERSTYVKGQKE